MKRIFSYLVLSVFVLCAKAQTNKPDSVKTYIEIWSMHKSSTPTIDTGEGKGSETYRTEDGRVIEFHSSMGAVNWFISNGWNLESEHLALSNDRCVKMYVVSKEVPLEQVKAKANKYIKK